MDTNGLTYSEFPPNGTVIIRNISYRVRIVRDQTDKVKIMSATWYVAHEVQVSAPTDSKLIIEGRIHWFRKILNFFITKRLVIGPEGIDIRGYSFRDSHIITNTEISGRQVDVEIHVPRGATIQAEHVTF